LATRNLKASSYEYGTAAQEQMLKYYRQSKISSASNHEYLRVMLAFDLVKSWALPRLSHKVPGEITVVDIGCSIGLFAIQFAKRGYNSYGIDFDSAAIEIARRLNDEENASAQFMQMDVADWNCKLQPIDIAICFDLFEHLHDDELGALFHAMKKQLSKDGCIVFHTLPQKYDYLFWNGKRGIVEFPAVLRPFFNLRSSRFSRVVEIYSLMRDIVSLCKGSVTHKKSIKKADHPNPLTKESLSDILERAGYEVLKMDTGFLGEIQVDPRYKAQFLKQPVTHRSIYGVTAPRKQGVDRVFETDG
jgi:2-polyprenyl-3-methyl-5-hydroxy-6-metoxy-1,4-benzoquinol methylase